MISQTVTDVSTLVRTNMKPVLVTFVRNMETVVITNAIFTIRGCQFDQQIVSIARGGELVNVIISKPKIGIFNSKAIFVVIPIGEEINISVGSHLNNSPTASKQFHLAVDLERILPWWVDGIYSTG